jgi:phosphomevalonate kinase
VLEEVMDGKASSELLLRTLDASNSGWDNIVTPFKLPSHLTAILADIDVGSHTPTLVSKVLAWRKAKPDEANALWKNLHALNLEIEDNMRELSRQSALDPISYNGAISECAKIEASQWAKLPSYSTNSTVTTLADTADTFQRIRALIRNMSDLSDVPIEPAEQTRLLDQCMTVPGCVMAGVPGAGGFDAIFCIVISEEAKHGVEGVWQRWEEMSIGPLLAQEDFVGVRVESLESVVGLKEVL